MTKNSREKTLARERANQLDIPYATALQELRDMQRRPSLLEAAYFRSEVFGPLAGHLSAEPALVGREAVDDTTWKYTFETIPEDATELEARWNKSEHAPTMRFVQLQADGMFELVVSNTPTVAAEPNESSFDNDLFTEQKWAEAFEHCGLVDHMTRRSPTLAESELVEILWVSHVYKFAAVGDIDYRRIRERADDLREFFGVGFLEARMIDGRPDRVEIVMTGEAPFDAVLDMADFEDALIIGPADRPNLRWRVGVDAKGHILEDDFADTNEPHLALFAGSMAGKSVVVQSMLTQLMSNNATGKLRVLLVEPKIGLDQYANIAHVDHLIEMHQPSDDDIPKSVTHNRQAVLLGRLATLLLDDVIPDLDRRYDIFRDYEETTGQPINNFSHAWDIAAAVEPTNPEAADALRMPARLIIIEEALLALAKPKDPVGAAYHRQVIRALETISVSGRTAGVHLVIIAQHPDPVSVPLTLRRQSRTIGMKLPTAEASLKAIGETGLEQLPGYGHLLYGTDAGRIRGRSFYPDAETIQRLHQNLPKSVRPLPLPMAEIPELQAARDEEHQTNTVVLGTGISGDPVNWDYRNNLLITASTESSGKSPLLVSIADQLTDSAEPGSKLMMIGDATSDIPYTTGFLSSLQPSTIIAGILPPDGSIEEQTQAITSVIRQASERSNHLVFVVDGFDQLPEPVADMMWATADEHDHISVIATITETVDRTPADDTPDHVLHLSPDHDGWFSVGDLLGKLI